MKGFKMFIRVRCVGVALIGLLAVSQSTVSAQQVTTVRPPSASQAEATLEQAAAEEKYTFLVFYKTNDAATQAMAATLKEGLATRADTARDHGHGSAADRQIDAEPHRRQARRRRGRPRTP